MKRIMAIAALAWLITTQAFGQNKETRSVGEFDKVKVATSIRATLVPGDKHEVIVETNGVDVEDVVTDVKGGTLHIEMASGSFRSYTVDVRVVYKSLEGVRVSSSARVNSEGTLKADELMVKASSSGRVTLDVDVKKLKVDVSSSGRVDLNGSATTQVVDVSSSGRYAGFDVECEGAKVDVSSSGRVEVSVSKEIFADATSSGRVSYRGNPDKVIADTSSSGRISKAN